MPRPPQDPPSHDIYRRPRLRPGAGGDERVAREAYMPLLLYLSRSLECTLGLGLPESSSYATASRGISEVGAHGPDIPGERGTIIRDFVAPFLQLSKCGLGLFLSKVWAGHAPPVNFCGGFDAPVCMIFSLSPAAPSRGRRHETTCHGNCTNLPIINR